MKQKYYLTSLLLGSLFFLKAQEFGGWVSSYQSNGATVYYSYDAVVDSQGDNISVGSFEGSASDITSFTVFPTILSSGLKDAFIKKVNENGIIQWHHGLGSTADDVATGVAIDSDDNVYVTGIFEGTVNFGPYTLTSNGGRDIFIVKLNANGVFQWAKSIAGSSQKTSTDIAVDDNGNIFVCGMFSGLTDFDPGSGSANLNANTSQADGFILKLDGSGDYVWSYHIKGSGIAFPKTIVFDSSDHVYIAGYFTGTTDFNPGVGVNNLVASNFDSFFLKVTNGTGGYIWAKNIVPNSGFDGVNDIALDSQGNLYGVGFHSNSSYGSSINGMPFSGSVDSYLVKLNSSNGNFLSIQPVSNSSGDDMAKSVAVGSTGEIYVGTTYNADLSTNIFNSDWIFDVSDASSSSIIKYNTYLTVEWTYTLNGKSSINSISLGDNDEIVCSGFYDGTTDFDGGPGNFFLPMNTFQGARDFLLQVSQCDNGSTDEIISCGPYTWIDGNTYFANNNTATFTLPNAAGCDSVVTLDLTVWDCTNLNGLFCGASDISMNQLVNAETRPGALQYRFRITGANSQSWPNDEYVYTSNSKNFRFQFIPGAMWGETYGVEVAYSIVPGVFGPYGASCDVTLQSLASQPLAVVDAADCGSSVAMDEFIKTAWVPGALGYRFQIVGNNGAGWMSDTYVHETTAPIRKFRFIQIPGALFDEMYAVSVAYQDGSGNWTNYGVPCNIIIETPSFTQLGPGDCLSQGVEGTDFLQADNVIGASGYRFRVTGANSAGWPMDQIEIDRNNTVFWMDLANGWLPGENYMIEVAIQDAAGNYYPYGAPCFVVMAGTPSLDIVNVDVSLNTKATIEGLFGATASHNPFTRDFALNLVNANDTDAINVEIYDMSGKLIEASSVNPMDIESARFGANLATGMYMIQVTQGANQAVIRQVKN